MTWYLETERKEFQKFCSYCLILNFEIRVVVKQYELSMWQQCSRFDLKNIYVCFFL